MGEEKITVAQLRQLADMIVSAYDIKSALVDDEIEIYSSMQPHISNFFKAAVKAQNDFIMGDAIKVVRIKFDGGSIESSWICNCGRSNIGYVVCPKCKTAKADAGRPVRDGNW